MTKPLILPMVMSTIALNPVVADESAQPPSAKKVHKVETLHGQPWADDYYWLRDKPNPDVAAYLQAENAYTDAVMRPTEGLQAALYKEMLGHIKETDLSVPYREGGSFYYLRTA